MRFFAIRPFAILLLSIAMLFGLSACEEKVPEQASGIAVPSTDIDEDWKKFVKEVAQSKKIKGKTKGIYLRFFGTMDDPTPHLKDTQNMFNRGVEPGTLLVFGSNNSRNMSDLLVTALSMQYIDGKLAGSRLLFVGQREHEAAVRDASVKSGVNFEFYPTN